MKSTGHIRSSEPMLNQLFSNIIWGQKGNCVDVPTDCMNYDTELFFFKLDEDRKYLEL